MNLYIDFTYYIYIYDYLVIYESILYSLYIYI